MIAEPMNTHSLFWLKVIKKGKVLVRATTVAPKPRLTRIMGKAQQTKVPVETKSAIELKLVLLFPRDWVEVSVLYVTVVDWTIVSQAGSRSGLGRKLEPVTDW